MTAHRYATCITLAAVSLAIGQVTLSTGVTVPKDHFIVYICVGNSEMEGQTTVSPGGRFRPVWDSTSPRLWNFNVNDANNPGPNHTWIPAHGKNHASCLAQYPNWLGPDMPLLKELVKQYPSDYYFGILKIASQGDRMYGQLLLDQIGWGCCHQWTQIADAIAAIGPNTVTWGGLFAIFCNMEENDARMGYSGAAARLAGMAADAETLLTRVRLQTNSDVPLIWVQTAGALIDWMPAYTSYFVTGYQQSMLIPTQISRAANIPMWWLSDTAQLLSTYYQTADGHLNDTGSVRLAQEIVSVIKANNWIPSPGQDTATPTAPTNLAASSIGITSVTLTWSPSTDDKGVGCYIVYRNGDSVATVALTSATVAGLAASTTYTFTVRARDFSGKLSPLSAPLQVTTAPPGSDTQAPTVPSGLHAVSVGLTGAIIAWSASTDNVGVTGYIVYQGGAPLDTVTATQDTINGLTQQTAYSFTVAARDGAGNVSSPSSALQVTTGSPVAFPFKVNVGGSAMGDYLADKQWTGADYGYTGTTSVAVGSGDVTGTTQDSVFYSLRCGADMGYRVPAPAGLYDITLMFAEFWHPAGDRVFTPFINGVAAVPQPIDVAALVGLNALYTLTVRAEVSTGLIDITFTHQGGDGSGQIPILNALAVDNAPAYVLQSPVSQSVYHVGDTLHIRWAANTYLTNGADILLSADEGDEWKLVNTEGTVFARDPTWGDYPFVIPQQLAGVSLVGAPLTLKLSGYNSSYSAQMSGTFTVLPSSTGAVDHARRAERLRVGVADGGRIVVAGVPADRTAVLELHALNGALVQRCVLSGSGAVALADGKGSAGAYVAVLCEGGRRIVARLVAR